MSPRLAFFLFVVTALISFMAGWHERGVSERRGMFEPPFLRRLQRRLSGRAND
jgi:hypothetical protein